MELPSPFVSVLLPIRNAAATVGTAVEDLLAQTWRNLEIIAVDDGSDDGSAAVLRTAAARDPRVVVLSQPPRGIAPALNAAIAAARGDFLARMDADDRCTPERIEKQVGLLLAHPDVDVASCRIRFAGDRARHGGYAHHVDWINTLLEPDEIALNRFVESPLAHPSAVFRRTAVERWGGYCDGPFPEDYELWLRWLDGGARIAKHPDTLLEWSDPPQRLSRTDPRYGVDAFYELKAGYLARWLERHNPHHPRITVWGAGVDSRPRAEKLTAHGVVIERYVDISPGRIGQLIRGRPVIAPEFLPPPGDCFVVSYVASRGARALIASRLAAQGCRPGLHYLCAA